LKAERSCAACSALVLITSRYSGSFEIFCFHRYTDRIGPTMLTQAANLRSTNCKASVSASCFCPIVVSTMRAVVIRPPHREYFLVQTVPRRAAQTPSRGVCGSTVTATICQSWFLLSFRQNFRLTCEVMRKSTKRLEWCQPRLAGRRRASWSSDHGADRSHCRRLVLPHAPRAGDAVHWRARHFHWLQGDLWRQWHEGL